MPPQPSTGTVTADGLSLGDNEKAQFGAGNDLQIYHDGTDSFIKETGAGSLKIWAKDFEVYNAGGTETLINADVNAGVQLYFDNAIKRRHNPHRHRRLLAQSLLQATLILSTPYQAQHFDAR